MRVEWSHQYFHSNDEIAFLIPSELLHFLSLPSPQHTLSLSIRVCKWRILQQKKSRFICSHSHTPQIDLTQWFRFHIFAGGNLILEVRGQRPWRPLWPFLRCHLPGLPARADPQRFGTNPKRFEFAYIFVSWFGHRFIHTALLQHNPVTINILHILDNFFGKKYFFFARISLNSWHRTVLLIVIFRLKLFIGYL